jgi:hypothetical protein
MVYTPQTWANGPTGGTPLSAARMAVLEKGVADAHGMSGGYYLDSYTGTDDQKLTAAIAAQQASGGSSNMAPIILPSRPLTFNQTRSLYSGLKLVGARPSGQKNPELAGGNYVGPEITLGSGISSGAGSWWVGSGSLYDIFMADFSVQGSQGASTHQFLDHNSGTLYACEFRALSFNFMRGVFGIKNRACFFTQVNLTGTWTINNLWDTQLWVGGSDNQLWMGGYVNIGPSSSSAQTGTYADADYQIVLSGLTNTSVGYIYLSALNGWRGLRQVGATSEVAYFGGVYEGYKPTRVNGLLSGPAPGTVMRVDDGAASFFGTKFGQGMDNPDGAEGGLVQVNGGEVALVGCNWYGQNMGSANAVDHNGGRLYVAGATKRRNEVGVWSNRPRVATTATAGSGDFAFSCPDSSVAVV